MIGIALLLGLVKLAPALLCGDHENGVCEISGSMFKPEFCYMNTLTGIFDCDNEKNCQRSYAKGKWTDEKKKIDITEENNSDGTKKKYIIACCRDKGACNMDGDVQIMRDAKLHHGHTIVCDADFKIAAATGAPLVGPSKKLSDQQSNWCMILFFTGNTESSAINGYVRGAEPDTLVAAELASESDRENLAYLTVSNLLLNNDDLRCTKLADKKGIQAGDKLVEFCHKFESKAGDSLMLGTLCCCTGKDYCNIDITKESVNEIILAQAQDLTGASEMKSVNLGFLLILAICRLL